MDELVKTSLPDVQIQTLAEIIFFSISYLQIFKMLLASFIKLTIKICEIIIISVNDYVASPTNNQHVV